MFEEILFQYSEVLANPIIYGFVLFALIVTQVFGFLYLLICIIAAQKMTFDVFFLVTISMSLFGEVVCYCVGYNKGKFLKKTFPRFFGVVKEYSGFNTILLARFAGVPLLSYALGISHARFQSVLLASFIFFVLNGGTAFFLGKTIPTQYLIPLIGILIVLSLLQIIFKKKRIK